MRQPVLFLGHGSPLNVLSKNSWAAAVTEFGKKIQKPKAIVLISAHWVQEDLKIHFSPRPKTIHDFSGFPRELYEIQYPAPGSEELARRLQELRPEAEITGEWGFDHGSWGVLHFLRPQADIPVVPVSLRSSMKATDFLKLGEDLRPLREENILILGSGNIVHNLQEIDFLGENTVFDWALDFDSQVKALIENDEIPELVKLPEKKPHEFRRAHPTSEHWAPLLVCLGASDPQSKVNWIFEGLQNGSISMRSLALEAG
jgi:4,5-DOPA dioxygenase extradiol